MALIPRQHVVALNLPVDPDWDFTVNGTIEAGLLVELDANGFVQAVVTAGDYCIGFAGDNLMNAGGGTAYSAALAIGANGAQTTNTQNRVSDFFNETVSSGLMTVYQGGGRFFTDQFADVTFTPGDQIYAAAGGAATNVAAGNNFIIGYCAAAPTAYPSGVPGTDTADNSISLGTFLDVITTH